MVMSVGSKMGLYVACCTALGAGAVGHASAQVLESDTIFAQTPAPLRDRMFMRLGYVHVDVKTKSGEAYDVTGPVIRAGDLSLYPSLDPSPTPTFTPSGATVTLAQIRSAYNFGAGGVDEVLRELGLDGLGSPAGIKAKAEKSIGTPAISLGFYLGDEQTWVAEAFVLAVPLKPKIYGAGVNASGLPNGLSGKQILSTKLLPPTVTFGRYFGAPESKFRPYLGVAAMYAIFYDTKATAQLNEYQGGAQAGDTSVSLKNAFGIGPAIGVKYAINSDWHLSFNLSNVKLKTEATLVTKNTMITSGSAVLNDYDPALAEAIYVGENGTGRGFGDNYTTRLLKSLIAGRNLRDGRSDTSLGTFVRKQKTTLDNTVFMLSVGRSF